MRRKLLAEFLVWKNSPTRKPLILKGVRQTGKTYLLKEFGSLAFPKFHYLNFENEPKLSGIFERDLNPKRILKDIAIALNTEIDIRSDLVIFDEIQACPKALTSLKYFCEDLSQLHLCAAGSLLGIHLGPISFPVGKVSFLTLRPLSFTEFLDACNEKKLQEAILEFDETQTLAEIAHDRLWELLKVYFVVGGMPEAVKTYLSQKDTVKNFYAEVRLKQEEIIESYYADIAKHAGKVNSMHITRVFKSVPTQLQQVQDGSVAKYRIKGVVPGISHYNRLVGAVDWLEAAGLILKIPIVNCAMAPLLAYTTEPYFKMMLFDVGIMGFMAGLSPEILLDYNYGTYKGFFAENFVAQEFLASSKANLFSWNEKTAEIEFLREIAGKIVPVEVKSGTITKAKSLQVFISKYNPKISIILSGKPPKIKAGNILYYPLYLANKVGALGT